MKYIIGVDIGTTNTKAVAYSTTGEVLAQANAAYPFIAPTEGYHELDPLRLYDAVCDVIRETVQLSGPQDPEAICFSSAMHGLIAVDEGGSPLTNMITWADLRSSAYAKRLKNTEAGKRLHERTGTPVHAMSPLCKLMWMREELPDIFLRAFKFISIKEFIFFRFFGRFIVDHSVASSTGLFDIHTLAWNKEALQLAGITEEKLSDHVAADTIINGLLNDQARLLSISTQTPFVIGGSDGCMAHIGSNALNHGDVSITIGTSGAVRIMNDKPVSDPRHRIFNYLITDDLYLSGGPINNGGNVLQWLSTHFLKKSFESSHEIESFIDEALAVKEGSEGLIFLPYIFGERAPVWDADARGIYFGVSAVHTISHFMRAAMEGISFALYGILHSVEELNGPAREIYASGGFIKSRKWVGLLADVLGKKLHVMHTEDSSAAGAAILGLRTLGLIKDFKQAATFFKELEIYEPDMEAHRVYMRNYQVYSNLYDKFRELKS